MPAWGRRSPRTRSTHPLAEPRTDVERPRERHRGARRARPASAVDQNWKPTPTATPALPRVLTVPDSLVIQRLFSETFDTPTAMADSPAMLLTAAEAMLLPGVIDCGRLATAIAE